MAIDQSLWFVFILGAGFSQPYGAPVMRDFMQTARRRYWAQRGRVQFLDACYESMFEFQAKCQDASRYFNRDWENIEELYTQADLLRLAEQSKESELRCEQIAWAIWDVYRSDAGRVPPTHDFLVAARRENLVPAVITTNYDVHLERGRLETNRPHAEPKPGDANNRWFYPGFAWPVDKMERFRQDLTVAVTEHAPDSSRVPIIKLHGSINWFQPRGSPAEWFALQPGAVRDVENSIPEILETHTPAIIPPMLGKASVAPVIAAQWKAAMSVLARARQIVVIGYSFPATDAFMLRLLSEGLKSNMDLDRILIIDRNPVEKWAPLLRSIFNPVARSAKVRFMSCTSSHVASDVRDQGFGPYHQAPHHDIE